MICIKFNLLNKMKILIFLLSLLNVFSSETFRLGNNINFVVSKNAAGDTLLDLKVFRKVYPVLYFALTPRSFEILYSDGQDIQLKPDIVYKQINLSLQEETTINGMINKYPALKRLITSQEKINRLKIGLEKRKENEIEEYLGDYDNFEYEDEQRRNYIK
jgi:hypothetical protein